MHLHEYSCKSCENKRGCLCTSERGKRIKLNIIIVPVSQIVSISQETNFCDENTYQGIVFIKKIKKVQKVISVGIQGPPKSKLTFGPISRRNTARKKIFFPVIIVPVIQNVSIRQETNFYDENTYQGIVFIKKIKKVQKVISVGFQGPPKSKLTFGPISRRNTARQKFFFQ